MIDDLMEIIAKLDNAPPVPRGILATLKVPWGKSYRQWDTRGRLWIWMNRAELLDAIGPRVKKQAPSMEVLMGVDIFYV